MKDRFSHWFWDLVVRRMLFRRFFRRHEAKMRAVEAKLDAGSGIEPLLLTFSVPDGAQEVCSSAANLVTRYRNFQVPPLLQIAPLLAAGNVFGLEYLALTPPAERETILARLHEMLPYARINDQGEIERPMLRAAKRGSRTCRFWTISLALEPPGYGISDAQIETHSMEFVAAAREFRQIADHIVQTLLRVNDIPLDTLLDIGSMRITYGIEYGHSIVGHKLENWHLEFREEGALFFTHLATAQEVRVSMYHCEVGGILHPHGFSRFLKTTPHWDFLAALLGDDYFDARRVIEKLHERGCWETIPRNQELRLSGTNGLAAPLV